MYNANHIPQHQSETSCDISLVVPCFNEEEALPFFYAEANKALAALYEAKKISSHEFIFVDDGSADGTVSVLRALRDKDASVRYVSFSRNFGKEAALYAGLSQSRGKFTATLDADLQDPPALLPEMLDALLSGEADCAATRRVNRKGEPPVRSFFARCFYRIMHVLTNIDIVGGARDFRLMTRRYTDAVLSLAERNRFSKGIFPWVGFRTKWFAFKNTERVAGKTKWSFTKLFAYSLDGIFGFSTKPLALASFAGITAMMLAFAGIVFIIVRKLLFGDEVAGWPSLACIILFVGGVQLFAVGILGQYVAKIYTEVKGRPLFIVRETEESRESGT